MFSAARMANDNEGEETTNLRKSPQVMTVAERQITKKLIEEREERVQAVNELWTALREVQGKIGSGGGGGGVGSYSSAPSNFAAGSSLDQVKKDVTSELASLRTELDSQPKLLHELEVLKMSQRKVELQVQELTKRMETFSPPPRSSLGNSMPSSSGGGDVGALTNEVHDLADRLEAQSAEIQAFRSVLVEMHVNLPLHAVRASRIALRSTELSQEERKMALKSLEEKEQQIKDDIVQLCADDASQVLGIPRPGE